MLFAPYSKSRLDASDCPWAFANTYIGREALAIGMEGVNKKYAGYDFRLVPYESEDRVNLVFGNVVHEIIEDIINERMKGLFLKKEDLIKIVDKRMRPMIAGGPDGFDYLAALKIAERFDAGYSYNYDPEFIAGTEMELGIDFDANPCEYDDPDCFVRMKADVLELYPKSALARLTDHKSQLSISKVEDSFQLALYALVVLMNYKMVDKVVVRLNFCRYGRYEETFYTREDMEGIYAALKSKVKHIEGRTNLKPAKRCSYCAVCNFAATHCPMLRNEARRKIKTPRTQSEAVLLFEKLIGLETQVKSIKALLKDWCDVNAAKIVLPQDLVEDSCTDKLCIGYRETESKEYNQQWVKELFAKYNFNIEEYLLTDKKKLDRIIKTKRGLKELFPVDADRAEKFKEELLETMIITPKIRFDSFKEKSNLNRSEDVED